jgi:hypothetical protein
MARFYIRATEKDFAGLDIPYPLIEFLGRTSFTIFINSQFGREADLIIFTKHAVHLFEVKRYAEVSIDEEGNWVARDDNQIKIIENTYAGIKENPQVQAENTAKALEQKLKLIFKQSNKQFNGKVYPYVILPNASERTREELKKELTRGWAWVLTSINEIPNSIATRDQWASRQVDFWFTDEDIALIAKRLRMKQTDEILGIKLEQNQDQANQTTSSQEASWPPIDSPIPGQKEFFRPAPDATVPPRANIQTRSILSSVLQISLVAIFLFTCIALSCVTLGWLGQEASKGRLLSFLSNFEIDRFFINQPTTVSTELLLPAIQSRTSVSAPTNQPSQGSQSTQQPTALLQTTEIPSPEAPSSKHSATEGGLTVTVEKIETEPSFIIWISATNDTEDRLTLPLFGYFFVVDNMRNQYVADPFSSSFPKSIAPGATVSGTIVMETPLNPAATHITLVFSQVFGSFDVDSISIRNIPLK